MSAPQRSKKPWLIGTAVLLVLGVVFGLIMQNVLLGLVLSVLISAVWLWATASWKSGNAGVNDESHGIEL